MKKIFSCVVQLNNKSRDYENTGEAASCYQLANIYYGCSRLIKAPSTLSKIIVDLVKASSLYGPLK
jgi:hypothetical protein